MALTKEQIENWRRIMFQTFGPVAFILPDSEIQAYRDRLQAMADKLPTDPDDDEETPATEATA